MRIVAQMQPPAAVLDELQTLAEERNRARMTKGAVKAVLSIAEAWGATDAEAAALLGVSASTWDRMKAGSWDDVLSPDQLTRALALIGLFKGLHLVFDDGMVYRWPKLPNRGSLFDRLSPVQAMIVGGIPRMLEIRQYIDTLGGGH